MKIVHEPKLDFDDVLLMPQRTTVKSRKDITLTRDIRFYYSPRIWNGIPILCSNMSFSSIEFAKELAQYQIITCIHKYHTIDQVHAFFNLHPSLINYVWISIGCGEQDVDFIKLLSTRNIVPNVCIDVPNGHMDTFVSYCKDIRHLLPDSILIAGNVCNTSSTQELIIHGGVDIVKLGIGGGSACTTRFMTGCGLPQLSCCIDNSYVAHGLKSSNKKIGLVCSDGGCIYPGDVAKVFASGSDFCMLGGFFAGSDECPGEWSQDKKMFTYYGMSTHYSQLQYTNSIKEYRASEGKKIIVPNKGSVHVVVKELLGGLRSACTYIGAISIKDMPKCAEFIKVNKIHNRVCSYDELGV